MLSKLSNLLHSRQHYEEILGWVIFGAVLVWFDRTPPSIWTTHLPAAHNDILEALWQTDFWRSTVLNGVFQPVSPVAFYPLGVHQMVLAHIGTGLLLLPISLIAGSVVAVNIGDVAGLILCFLGARAFLKHFSPSPFLASIGATIVTFALGRTFHIYFHLNVSIASAAGIWMGAMLMNLRRYIDTPRAKAWAIGSGICWGIAIIAQPYFVFLASVLFLLLGRQWRAWKYAPLSGISALVIAGPLLVGVMQGATYMDSRSTSLRALNAFSATPGSYLGWGHLSAWEALTKLPLSRQQSFFEVGAQNWGIVAPVLSVFGAVLAWRTRSRRALLALLVVSGTLSFGPIWRASPLYNNWFRHLNELFWEWGADLKPQIFSSFSAELKNDSVPLPGILPVMLVPRYEFARVAARYSIWVGLVVAALSLIVLSRLPRGLATILACLWVIELLPQPRQPQPAPARPHPAHEWAAQQIVGTDLAIYSPPGMEFVYSHYLVGNLPGANITGPFVPGYLRYTHPWITYSNLGVDPLPEALIDPAHAVILRRAQVGIVLLRPEAANVAKQNSALRYITCFELDSTTQVYHHSPLCAFEVIP